jgi:hypothetical protein
VQVFTYIVLDELGKRFAWFDNKHGEIQHGENHSSHIMFVLRDSCLLNETIVCKDDCPEIKKIWGKFEICAI